MLKTVGRTHFYTLLYNNCAVFSSKSELPGFGLSNVKKKVGDANVKVTLISQNEDVTIVSLAEAQKLSKRRELKLVKIIDVDAKTSRPVYKLMTGSDFYEEDMKRREQKREARKEPMIKGEKFVPVSCNIAEHDLQIHIKRISKWLQKFYEIRVALSAEGRDPERVGRIFDDILKETQHFGVVKQKQLLKNGSIKFQIVPNLNTSTDEAQGKDGNKIVQTSKPADENEIPETEQSDPKEKSSQAL